MTQTLERATNLFLGDYIPTTRESYNIVLTGMLRYLGPQRPVHRVTPIDLMEFIQHVRDRPEVTSPATINKYVKTLRVFFNWCVRLEIIQKSPAAALKYSAEKKRVDRVRAMPDAAFDQLVDYAKWDRRAFALVLFLGDTGCRIGGATGLRWSDVMLAQQTAKVTEKGSKTRSVYYGKLCSTALRLWKESQYCAGDNYVFSRDGNTITAPALGQYFRRLCQSAGIGSWGPHSLRHRKGYQLNDHRISPAVGAGVLGNTVDIFIKNYSPEDTDRIQAAVDELSTKSQQLILKRG